MSGEQRKNEARDAAIEEVAGITDADIPNATDHKDANVSSTWKKFGEILDVPVKILLIFTFGVGYFEYSSAVKSREVSASFDLVENWENDGYQEAYRRIGKRIDTLKANFIESFPNEANDPVSRRNFISGQIIELMETDEKLKNDATRIYYFFGKAGLCSEEEICDRDVLTNFFSDSAGAFNLYFLPYAQLQRADDKPQFGVYAEKFAKMK